MSAFHYPPSPAFVATEKLQPSAAFKKQVARTIFAIVLFFIVYLILVFAAVALAIACFYFGIFIIVALTSFIGIVGGAGLMAVGVSVIFFLIKFIFAVTKNENPARIEIKEADQPILFEYVRRLSEETKTPFPKKIFISPDVNAMVFYNSSFWSMLFPVRKNLEIGIGLVNSINISELKAVIAHEFGHFSQRSMKLGSFTYNVNKIIYDMLYNNKNYSKFLSAWAQLHGLLYVFASITAKIAEAIQYVLRQMYKVVNKSYMALSREMEFHADAVAASAAGGNNIISGLCRIELAASCYNTILSKADDFLKQNKKLENVFENQLTVYKATAKTYDLPIQNGLPVPGFDFIRSFSTSRINYKNQWASHPELKDRKEHLDVLDFNVSPDETSAWVLFNHQKAVEQELTEKLYINIQTDKPLQVINPADFDKTYVEEMSAYELPEVYKGYYDKRFIDMKDWNFDELSARSSSLSFNEIFSKTNSQLKSAINNINADVQTLKAIKNKIIDVKTFDFDGEKYNRKDCDLIIAQLEKEAKQKSEKLNELDKEAFIFFKAYANNLDASYQKFKLIAEEYEEYYDVANGMFSCIQPLYDGGLSIEQVHSTIRTLKSKYDKKIKQYINGFMLKDIIKKEKHEVLYNEATTFIQKDFAYFVDGKFMNNELDMLRKVTIDCANIYYDLKFTDYKLLLQTQLSAFEAQSINNGDNLIKSGVANT